MRIVDDSPNVGITITEVTLQLPNIWLKRTTAVTSWPFKILSIYQHIKDCSLICTNYMFCLAVNKFIIIVVFIVSNESFDICRETMNLCLTWKSNYLKLILNMIILSNIIEILNCKQNRAECNKAELKQSIYSIHNLINV